MFALIAPGAGAATPPAGEDLASATGPVAGETSVTGTFESGNEQNWWYIQLAASSQVTLTIHTLASSSHNCFGSGWNFTDYFGKTLSEGYFIGHGETEQTYVFKYTTPPAPAVATYYVERAPFNGGVGCSYSWSMSPASAVITTPPAMPMSVGETEPNDQPAVANGPLLNGQRFDGTISTINDVDNFYFNALPNEALTLEMTGHRGCSGNDVYAKVTGPFGTKAEVGAVSNSRSDQTFTTAVYGGHYNVAVSGQLGCRWQLRVVAGVLSPTPVLPVNGGAGTIAAAPPLVFGQTHQGGDMPVEYWKVPGMYPGDHLLLGFTKASEGLSHVRLYAPGTTDLFVEHAKAVDAGEARSQRTVPVILRGNFKGTGIVSVDNATSPFSFVPFALAHKTTATLEPFARHVRKGRRIKLL